ncbi:MAG: hypothetical protein M0D55_08805 [Elusimicrobiota bacterium]|nr:MAG: hypothetical protein M0D55_08805 [Elusimicrobiota bacterium]
MTRPKSLLIAFAAVLVVFVITHALKFPGSLAHLMEATGGQKILDMQASFSSDETYRRLEAMGEHGRRMYLRTVLTIDLVFPLTVFAFFTVLARFTTDRLSMSPALRKALGAMPAAYLALDFIENAIVLALLWHFPARLELLGGAIGYFTRGKRIAMLLAMFLPPALFLKAKVA